MKKIVILIFAFISVILSSCKNEDNITLYVPDGTPALAITNILDNGFSCENMNVVPKLVSASDIAGYVSKDSNCLAIMPTVSAATLYNKGVDIKIITTNIFGNLYIASTSIIESFEKLKGNIIYVTIGTTQSMLTYLLDKNNIEYQFGETKKDEVVTISSKKEAQEIIPLLKLASNNNETALAVLGEPQLTQAMSKVDGLSILFDMQEEYKKYNSNCSYPQASLVGKNKILNEEMCNKLYDLLSLNEKYLIDNLENLNDILKKYDSSISSLNFTKETIKRCYLGLEKSYTIKDEINNYVKMLNKIELDDNFYYQF